MPCATLTDLVYIMRVRCHYGRLSTCHVPPGQAKYVSGVALKGLVRIRCCFDMVSTCLVPLWQAKYMSGIALTGNVFYA